MTNSVSRRAKTEDDIGECAQNAGAALDSQAKEPGGWTRCSIIRVVKWREVRGREGYGGRYEDQRRVSIRTSSLTKFLGMLLALAFTLSSFAQADSSPSSGGPSPLEVAEILHGLRPEISSQVKEIELSRPEKTAVARRLAAILIVYQKTKSKTMAQALANAFGRYAFSFAQSKVDRKQLSFLRSIDVSPADIASDAISNLLNSKGKFRGRSIVAYVRKAVNNLINDLRRTAKRLPDIEINAEKYTEALVSESMASRTEFESQLFFNSIAENRNDDFREVLRQIIIGNQYSVNGILTATNTDFDNRLVGYTITRHRVETALREIANAIYRNSESVERARIRKLIVPLPKGRRGSLEHVAESELRQARSLEPRSAVKR